MNWYDNSLRDIFIRDNVKNCMQCTQQLIYIIHICRQMELLADHQRFVHGLVDTTVLLLERSPLDHTRSDTGVGRVFDSVYLAKQRRHLDTQVKLFDRLTDTFLTVADMLVNKSKCFHGNFGYSLYHCIAQTASLATS